MLEKSGFETATDAMTLGMMANDAAIASLHYQESRSLDERDRSSLTEARRFLSTLADVSNGHLAETDSLLAIGAISMPDETIDAIEQSLAVDSNVSTSKSLAELTEIIDHILTGEASDAKAAHVCDFFDNLGQLMLNQAEASALTTNDHRRAWTVKA